MATISDILSVIGTVALTLLLSKPWDRMTEVAKTAAQKAMFEDVDYLLRR